MCKPRLLRAEEIDCRAQQVKQYGCQLLLYKDARCDMAILDETFGEMNWKRSHEIKGGMNCCTISIWDSDKKEWVSREDVGIPAPTEAEKSQFSDAFKRASTNWGVGRELYSAPFIWVKLDESETYLNDKSKKYQLQPQISFRVSEIYYFEREICGLTIVDQAGKERYTFGCDIASGVKQISEAADEATLKQVWKNWSRVSHPALLAACKQRMNKLNISK